MKFKPGDKVRYFKEEGHHHWNGLIFTVKRDAYAEEGRVYFMSNNTVIGGSLFSSFKDRLTLVSVDLRKRVEHNLLHGLPLEKPDA